MNDANTNIFLFPLIKSGNIETRVSKSVIFITMNRISFITLLFLYTFIPNIFGQISNYTSELVIYTDYEFVKYGLAEKTIPLFEQKNSCKVRIVTYEDADEIISQAIKEKENPQADILLGINKRLLIKVKNEEILQSYQPINYKCIKRNILFDPEFYIIPYCYNYLAFIYDSNIISEPPQTFSMFLDGSWNKSVIIPNPETSKIGSSFFLWTVAVFSRYAYLKFWRGFKKVINRITMTWDKAYCLLLQEEVPIIVGYANLPAYHLMNDNNNRYKAFIPQEGAYCQIEGMGITNNCPHPELARKFVEYVLSVDFQKYIPLHQWMFPANKNVKLPEYYKKIPKVKKIANIPSEEIDENYEYWLRQWDKMTRKQEDKRTR